MSDLTPMELAAINLRIMVSDAEAAIQDLTSREEPAIFQCGVLLGLSAASHLLNGHTADEAWDKVAPIVARFRQELQRCGDRDE